MKIFLRLFLAVCVLTLSGMVSSGGVNSCSRRCARRVPRRVARILRSVGHAVERPAMGASAVVLVGGHYKAIPEHYSLVIPLVLIASTGARFLGDVIEEMHELDVERNRPPLLNREGRFFDQASSQFLDADSSEGEED